MLTRSGWGALFAAGAAAVAGRVFGIIELYVLAAGVAATVVWAVLWIARPAPRLSVRRRIAPPSVNAGEAARVDLVISNDGAHRTPVLRLWEPVAGAGAVMHLAPLRSGERAAAAYRLPTSRRGVVTSGPMRVRRADPLGLAARTTVLAGAAELLVAPQHRPVHLATTLSSGRLGDLVRMRALGLTGTEFQSLREYVAGDDPRRIDWKASARTGDLIVKEHAPEGLRRCTVVLDLDAAAYGAPGDTAAAFERAVSIVASVVTGAVSGGLNTRLLSHDLDARGPDVATRALRWLATVDTLAPGSTPDVPALQTVDGLGLLVVVSGSATAPLVGSTRQAAGPDELLVVVATAAAIVPATGTNPSGTMVIDACDHESFQAGWNRLVAGNDPLDRLPTAYRDAR